MKMRSAARKYITRVDYRQRDGRISSRGWFVRVPKSPGKLFSDSVYGGRRAARAAAVAYRDQRLHQLAIPLTSRTLHLVARSQIELGVFLERHRDGLRAVAFWSPRRGATGRATFPFKKYGGADAAIAAAIRTRRAQHAAAIAASASAAPAAASHMDRT